MRLIFTLLLCVSMMPLAAQQKPNVIIFLADDLGWTDLGCYGSTFYETPNIDKLADSGVKFTNAYSACNVCSPTRAALMTGKYPARLHLTDWIAGHQKPDAKLAPPDWTQYLSLDETTLAELLGREGYVTASIGKWHLGDEEKYWPENQGFDVNIAGWKKGSPNKSQESNGYFSPYGNPRLTDGPEGEYITDRLTEEAVRFINDHREKPFFLYMPFYAVHTPLQAKDADIEYFMQNRDEANPHHNAVYAAMIKSMDESVGRICNLVDASGLEGNTLIIFTSDNGGLIGRQPITSNLPLRAGKGTAYEGGVRVPAIFSWKGKLGAGQVNETPVITMDIYNTVAAFAGLNEKNLHTDGENLAPLLLDGKKLRRNALYWHYPHYHTQGAAPHSMVRKGDMKLIYFYEDGKKELYDLAADPGEKRDMYADNKKVGEKLFRDLQKWLHKVNAQPPVNNPLLDKAGQ